MHALSALDRVCVEVYMPQSNLQNLHLEWLISLKQVLRDMVSWDQSAVGNKVLYCQYSSLRFELNSGEVSKDITVSDNSAEFLNLDCNSQYRPKVRAVFSYIAIEIDFGTQLFYGCSTQQILLLRFQVYLNVTRFNELYSFTTLKSVCWTRQVWFSRRWTQASKERQVDIPKIIVDMRKQRIWRWSRHCQLKFALPANQLVIRLTLIHAGSVCIYS